jgi:nicotinamidase-related amidase
MRMMIDRSQDVQEPSSRPTMSLRIEPWRAALLIVDVQAKLAAAMQPAAMASCERNLLVLVELARRLGIPIVLSEQYPKGLGSTLPSLLTALDVPGIQLHRLEKLTFACTDSEAFPPLATRLGRSQWIVTGMEAHICVWQTVRGLLEAACAVHVPGDAVMARDPANQRLGLALMERAGATITGTETVAFDALGRAGTEDFKAISRMVK